MNKENYLISDENEGKYVCSYCGKFIAKLTRPKSIGADLAYIKRTIPTAIVKNYLLFGDPHFRLFCSKECCKNWFNENITEENRAKSKQISNDLEELKERAVKDITKGIGALQDTFNQLKQEGIKVKTKAEFKQAIIKRFNENLKGEK